MSLVSAVVVAGNDALAAEPNALREDILRHAGDVLTDTGAANAYVVTCDNQITALSAGQMAKFVVANGNTGPSTLRFKNTLSLDETDSILWEDGTEMKRGEMPAGSVAITIFDGTNWRIKSVKKNAFRTSIDNLKSSEIVIDYKTSEMTKASSSANLNHYEFIGESKMNTSSSDDLMSVSRNLTQFGGTSIVMDSTGIPFSISNAWRNGNTAYTQGFFGFRSAIDCPGATDTAHHAGFIMDGTSLYASVGSGAAQTKSADLGYSAGISEYQTYKVEYDGTDWNFYIDDMDTPVATLTTNKPTINSLTKMFLAIDSNNGASQTIYHKNIFTFTSQFA